MLLVKTFLARSPLHGIGLFAADFIPSGAAVWAFRLDFDQKLTREDVEGLSPAAREQVRWYAYQSHASAVYVLCADDARFFNHADTPNVIDDPSDEGTAVAARDIREGEELTSDYRTYDADWRWKLAPASNSA